MVAEILSVGTELLLGQIVDTNAAWLAQRLAELGIDLYRKSVVGDNIDRCAAAILEALERADVVLITGGLGPTQDDITRDAIAKVLGEELVINAQAAQHIEDLLARRGIRARATGSLLRQAYIPASARIIRNPVGTATGVYFERHDAANKVHVGIAMPGVPVEMKSMFEQEVVSILKERTAHEPAVIKSRVLRCVGVGESALTDLIEDLIANQTNPTIASLVSSGEVWLRLTAKAPSQADAQAILTNLENKIRQRVGQYIFGVDEESLEVVIGRLLKSRNWTLAAAESCTGGLLTDTLTNVPGSSDYVKGTIVAYANEVKTRLLGVDPAILSDPNLGAVSEECARAMSEGVRQALGATIGVSITGIAGPTGGTPKKPVGLVYISLSDPNGTVCERHLFGGTRRQIKERAVRVALNLIRKRYTSNA